MILQAYLDACRARRFRPGSHDCAQFAARWVAAQTGSHPGAAYRYRSMRAGMAALRADGYADHIAFAAAHLTEVHPVRAREGDIAAVMTPDGPALGICGGEVVWLAGATDLRIAPREAMVRSFRCPQ